MNTFKVVGKLKAIKDGRTSKDYQSGWMIDRLRFMVLSGNNTQFVEVSGGKWSPSSGKENTILTYTKASGDQKGQKLTVTWEERNQPDVLAKVAHFKKFVVDLEPGGEAHRKELEKAGDVAALEASKARKKEFLHESDFIEQIDKILASDKAKDWVFSVSGEIEYSYSTAQDGTGKFYRNFKPTYIVRVDENASQDSVGTVDLYYTAGAVEETETKLCINGYVKYYNNTAKKDLFAPFGVSIPNDDTRAAGFKKLFSNVEEGTVKHIGLTLNLLNGAEKEEITGDELSEEQQEMIDLGIMTKEEIIASLGGVKYGNRITENRISGVARGYTCPVITDYTADMLTATPEAASAAAAAKILDDDFEDLI